jgi:hypothetical protein
VSPVDVDTAGDAPSPDADPPSLSALAMMEKAARLLEGLPVARERPARPKVGAPGGAEVVAKGGS